jgi:hypothetical protein
MKVRGGDMRNAPGSGVLSDRELFRTLDAVRDALETGMHQLTASTGAESASVDLAHRVQQLEHQAQALEQEVIHRMLCRERGALARLEDQSPRLPHMWFDAPDELVTHHVLPCLDQEDLVALSEVSLGGLGATARLTLLEMADELKKLAELHPLIQESLSEVNLDQLALRVGRNTLLLRDVFQHRVRQRLGYPNGSSAAAELSHLYEQIQSRLHRAQSPPERRALEMLRTALVPVAAQILHLVRPALRAERDIVMAAVQLPGEYLLFASRELRADRDVVMAAVRKSPAELQYASQELQAAPEIMELARPREG